MINNISDLRTEVARVWDRPVYGVQGPKRRQHSSLSPRMMTLVSIAAALVLALVAPHVIWLLRIIGWLASWGHEMSHALIGVVTGARVNELVLLPDGSGATGTNGGAETLIVWAGFPGGLLWGAVLWRLGIEAKRWLMITVALFIGLSGLLWARSNMTLLVMLFIIGLVVIPRILPWPTISAVWMRVVGATIFFFGWWRLWELWFLGGVNDASIMEQLSGVGAQVWIGSWHMFGVLVTLWLVQGELRYWRHTGDSGRRRDDLY